MEDGSLTTCLKYCNKKMPKNVLITHLEVARDIDLPLFLYNRETGDDLLNILKECYFIEGKIGW